MSEPILRMEPTRLSVEPGGQAMVTVTVFNGGNVVEGYDVDVVSTMPMPWATASPATLSVYPQQEATTVITFAPPSGAGAPGGSFPFGVRLRSQVDENMAAVAEGDLDVGSVSGLQAMLTPVASSGRWGGRHTLKVSNWGNAPARLRIVAQDQDQALGFMVSPPELDVPLGGEAIARVKVRTRHPVLRGTPQRLPFQVVCEPEAPQELGGPRVPSSTPERPVVDGAFNQKPILTRMVVAIAGLLLLALIALIVWLVTKGGDPKPPPKGAAVISAPAGLAATAPSDGVVLLTWNAASDVDSYELFQTRPLSKQKKITALVDPKDPAKYLVRLKVETAEQYCYQLRALRDDGPRSTLSEPEQCVATTLEPSATPSPSAGPAVISELPKEQGEVPIPDAIIPSESASPSPSPPTPVTTEPSEDPQRFISVLNVYIGFGPEDPPETAVAHRAQLLASSVPAKLLNTAAWTLTEPLSPNGWVLYVDAPEAGALTGVCEGLLARFDVIEDCSQAQAREVAPPQ